MTALQTIHRALPPLLLFSLISNLAVLISPLFMMQVLDRVVPSGNTATLLLLGFLALGALALQALVEWGRDLALRRLGTWLEASGSQQAVALSADVDNRYHDGRSEGAEVSQRVARLVQALRGPVAQAGLSLPWLPVFVLVLLWIHVGFVGLLLAGVLAMVVLDQAMSRWAGARNVQAHHLQNREQSLFRTAPAQGSRLGMPVATVHLLQQALQLQGQRHSLMADVDRHQVLASSGSSFLRSTAQIMALGLGAYLVTLNQLSAGGMIAASLLLSRAYGSFETVMKQSAPLKEALADYRALRSYRHAPEGPPMDTPDFSGALRAETLTFPRGGGAMPYLDRVGFTLAPGECLVIVGAAGSGKSSLLHALSGQRMAPIGSVFYDESVLRSLSPAALSHWVGTLPQRADLIAGSLADNIACFDPDRQDGQVIAAATAAGVHGLIAALPEGYESDLSVSPHLLSAGQVQRVALARALYRQPRYLFLDEPNALLDGDGERALLQTLLRLKAAGTTIVMVLHRSGLMGMADKILQLDQGRVVDFGPRAEVLARLSGNHRRLRVPPLATSLHDLRDWVAAQFTRASDEPFSQKAQIVAQELFHLALEVSASQSSPPQELEFSLKFLNDLECELRMVGDASLDLGEKMVSVRKYLAAGHAPQGGLSRDEQALAALEQIGRSVTLQRQEEFCAYQVAVSATEEGSVPANMWRAQ